MGHGFGHLRSPLAIQRGERVHAPALGLALAIRGTRVQRLGRRLVRAKPQHTVGVKHLINHMLIVRGNQPWHVDG